MTDNTSPDDEEFSPEVGDDGTGLPDVLEDAAIAAAAPAAAASRPIREFIKSKIVRWSAAGVAFVGAVSFLGNFATIMSMFQPGAASSRQVEELQSELSMQREMIAQLLTQTAPTDPGELSPIREAERLAAATRVANAEPEAAQAIAQGDFRKGFRALKARADDLSSEAATAWRDLGALAYDRDPAIALEAYRRASEIDAGHYETWMSLADLEFDQAGDVEAAMAAAASAVDLAEDLPQRLSALNELAILEYEAGELQPARARFVQLISILRPLIETEAGDNEYLLALSDALDGLGDVESMMNDPGAALTAHQEVLSIRRRLLAAHPEDISARRDVSSALESIGELALAREEYTEAEGAFAESLALDRQIAEEDPESLSSRRNLSVSLEMYGDVLMELGRPEEALTHYRESLQISRLLLASHPSNSQFREDVGFALGIIAEAYEAVGDTDATQAAYSETVALFRGLAEDTGDELRAQLILIEALARAWAATGEEPYAIEARELLAGLRRQGLLTAEVEPYVEDAEALLATPE